MPPIKFYKITKQFLTERYLNTEKSLEDIANEIGCSRETVRRALLQYKLTSKYKYRGLIRTKKSFQKGHEPWNKGIKYTPKQKAKLKLSGLELGRLKKYHPCKSRSYGAIHYWVRSKKGKARKCSICGSNGGKKGCTWANIDHKYKKRLSDYFEACNKCHFEYDIKNGLRKPIMG